MCGSTQRVVIHNQRLVFPFPPKGELESILLYSSVFEFLVFHQYTCPKTSHYVCVMHLQPECTVNVHLRGKTHLSRDLPFYQCLSRSHTNHENGDLVIPNRNPATFRHHHHQLVHTTRIYGFWQIPPIKVNVSHLVKSQRWALKTNPLGHSFTR